MDLASPISYNGLTISAPSTSAGGRPASGYRIEQINISPVNVAEYLEKAALRDGMDAGDVFSAARTISISAAVEGSTPGDLWDNVQAWLAAFNPVLALAADTSANGFIPFDFYQPTISQSSWSSAGIPMRLYARPTASPTYVVERNAQGARNPGKGGAIRVGASLICVDPRKYLQTSLAIVMLSATTAAATHLGDYPTFPTVAISTTSATAGGASNFTIVIDSSSVVLDLSGLPSTTLTLDYANRSVVDGNGNSKASVISSVTDWAQIQPGGSTVGYLNGTNINSVHFTYREAWA